MKQPILVIMAAGMGSRYGGNKQIDGISREGDIIMDFSLYDAYQAGFRRVCFIIKHDFEEAFRAHMKERAEKFFETYYVFQEMDDLPEGYEVPEGRVKPWGTTHAVLAARSVIDAPFAVINADDYYGKEAFGLIYGYLREKADAKHSCMVGFSIENTLSENGTVTRGICRAEDGRLTDIEEHFKVGRAEGGMISAENGAGEACLYPEGTLVSMNMWGFGREFIEVMQSKLAATLDVVLAENPLKGECLLPKCVDEEIKAGALEVAVLHSKDQWFGVTYKEDKPVVVEKFAAMKEAGLYPRDLWA
ncbi:MAG: nucleotidyltransferase [Mogibacterium sp.]|nr:nucleotidyltransferase [Mogibacterium sp.]